jgi:hypothetical protein
MPASSGNKCPAIGISEPDDGLDPEALLTQHQAVERARRAVEGLSAEKVPAEVGTTRPVRRPAES